MKSYVYKITNTVNGKIYVGKSRRPNTRWIAHKTLARATMHPKSALPLYCAIREHGENAFCVEVVSTHDSDEAAYAAEAVAVDSLKSTDPSIGYNVNTGGCRGFTQPEYVRKRGAQKRIGRFVSEESRAKTSASNSGKKRTAETKALISAASRGRRWSDESKAKARASHLGQKRTEEQKVNYRAGAAKRIAKQRCIKWFCEVMAGVVPV
jgi:group I intron endonuclease